MGIFLLLIIGCFLYPVREITGQTFVDEIHIKTLGYGFEILRDPSIIQASISLIPYGIDPTITKSLVFEVKTSCSNAFVYLSASEDLNMNASLYELVFDGSLGKIIFLRRRVEVLADVVTKWLPTKHIFKCDQFSPFWISWESNIILIGMGNRVNEDTLCSFVETDPFTIHGIGVRSYVDNDAHWIIGKEAKGFFCVMPGVLYRSLKYSTMVTRKSACALFCSRSRYCMGFNYQTKNSTCQQINVGDSNVEYISTQDWIFSYKCWKRTCLACL